MTHSLSDDLRDLQTFSESKPNEPAEQRLKSLSAALSLYSAVEEADSESARARSKIDGMFDGRPPYDSAKLRAMGQGGRCNLNFGEAQRHLDAAQAGYIDLLTSTEHLVDVKVDSHGEDYPIQSDEANAILNEELTYTIRSWSEFAPRMLTLSTEFLKHGIGVAYFISATNWRFYSAGLADFKFPRNVRATEDAIDIGFAERPYSVAELFSFIESPEAAEKAGWNVEAVRKTLCNASRSKGTNSYDWEEWQRRYKNGDSSSSKMQVKSVELVHTWVKENSGKVSHYIWDKSEIPGAGDTDTDRAARSGCFLYKRENSLENSQEAYTIFSYGVGNNGTYHSVRGLGQRIFPQIQHLNRLQCQAADAAAISGGLLLQPNSMEDMRDLALQTFGPYHILRPNVDLVDGRTIPDLTKNMMPIIGDLRQQLADTSDFYSTARAAQGSPYRNTLQVRAELESATRLSSANLALFYTSWDRLLREVVRRIIEGPESDPDIKNFWERCKKRGLEKDQVKSVDHNKTRAARAIGSGNPAARVAVLDQMNQERPYLDEEGNRNLTFDRMAARVGHDAAKKYLVRGSKPRGTNEQSLATLENTMLQNGMQVPVLGAQFHGTHLELHLPPAQEFIQLITTGEIDPVKSMNILSGYAQHLSEHAQAASQDPNLASLVSLAVNTINKLSQIIQNTEAAVDSQEGSPEGNSQAQEALELSEVKKQVMLSEAETRRQIKLEDARQKQRLADFAAAAEQKRMTDNYLRDSLSDI